MVLISNFLLSVHLSLLNIHENYSNLLFENLVALTGTLKFLDLNPRICVIIRINGKRLFRTHYQILMFNT